MDFKENDLVVVKGYKKGAGAVQVLADIFTVMFVGAHELILAPRTKYAREPFKVCKSRCICLRLENLNNSPSPEIKLGDLVLGFECEYNGDLKDKKVGHVSEIIVNTNSKKYYVITTKNKDVMYEEDKVLLLQ